MLGLVLLSLLSPPLAVAGQRLACTARCLSPQDIDSPFPLSPDHGSAMAPAPLTDGKRVAQRTQGNRRLVHYTHACLVCADSLLRAQVILAQKVQSLKLQQ